MKKSDTNTMQLTTSLHRIHNKSKIYMMNLLLFVAMFCNNSKSKKCL